MALSYGMLLPHCHGFMVLTLPPVLVCEILNCLSLDEICKCARVNSTFRSVSRTTLSRRRLIVRERAPVLKSYGVWLLAREGILSSVRIFRSESLDEEILDLALEFPLLEVLDLPRVDLRTLAHNPNDLKYLKKLRVLDVYRVDFRKPRLGLANDVKLARNKLTHLNCLEIRWCSLFRHPGVDVIIWDLLTSITTLEEVHLLAESDDESVGEDVCLDAFKYLPHVQKLRINNYVQRIKQETD
eukprot:221010_1